MMGQAQQAAFVANQHHQQQLKEQKLPQQPQQPQLMQTQYTQQAQHVPQLQRQKLPPSQDAMLDSGTEDPKSQTEEVLTRLSSGNDFSPVFLVLMLSFHACAV